MLSEHAQHAVLPATVRAKDRSMDRKPLSLRCDPEQYLALLWRAVTCNHSCIRQELACYIYGFQRPSQVYVQLRDAHETIPCCLFLFILFLPPLSIHVSRRQPCTAALGCCPPLPAAQRQQPQERQLYVQQHAIHQTRRRKVDLCCF